jgi:hypothetical protein
MRTTAHRTWVDKTAWLAEGGVGFDKDVLLGLLKGLSRAAGSTRTYCLKAYAASVYVLRI